MKSLIDLIRETKKKKRIYICGNGGSACEAMHLAEDLLEKGYRAIDLLSIGFVTATGNDIGYNYIFSRPLKILADKGDILVTLSTSGISKNIIEAQRAGKQIGMKIYSFPTNKELNLPTALTQNEHLKIIHEIYQEL